MKPIIKEKRLPVMGHGLGHGPEMGQSEEPRKANNQRNAPAVRRDDWAARIDWWRKPTARVGIFQSSLFLAARKKFLPDPGETQTEVTQ